MQFLHVTIKPQKDRLDQFVSDSIKDISRSSAKKLVKDGFILVNGHIENPAYKVRKGDSIRVEKPLVAEVSLKAEKIPLQIVFEDKDLLVVDKPPYLVTHPTLDHPTGTLVNALLNHLKDLESKDLRPGIAHRLDKNTSGLIVVAKKQDILENLKEQFKSRDVRKIYTALVSGNVEKEVGTIEGRIDRHPKFRSKFVVAESGKAAKTEYRVLKRFGKLTLLELKPQTGRTHQLRVHLAHINHPIVGDKLYGGRMLLPRQFLHASLLEFNHPKAKERLTFESKLPKDLADFLDKLD